MAARHVAIARPDAALRSRGRPSFGAARRALDGIGGLGWSVLGFVAGAVFWHFIGFWSFVSDVVLVGDAPPAAMRAAEPIAIALADTPSAQACTRLALDRRTGETSAHACDADSPLLPADAFEGRQDRMPRAGQRSAAAPHDSDEAAGP
ncbi:hypothetical protein [Hyphomicrobium sp.]|uniref:hypothetical protein n=1 Tax=Hyphomicrobium sp. TaxID=82 RepID=UPI002FDC8711